VKYGVNRSGRKTPDLRPLTSRSLKSIADTLRPFVPGAKVIDLFAGQGRFGARMLEMGAELVVFVEKDKKSCELLDKNLKNYLGKYKIVQGDCLDFLNNSRGVSGFDLLFADPPYRLWEGQFSEALMRGVQSVLGADSIFLVRYPKKVLASPSIQNFTYWKTSTFGDSEVMYLRFDGHQK